MNKPIIIFDWEVFPTWNCVVWTEYQPNVKDCEYHVITSDMERKEYIQAIKDLGHRGYLTGFNIKAYDLQIMNFARNGYTPEELYEHNEKIMETRKDANSRWADISFWRNFEFIDLYDDIKTMGSLKQFESNTGLSIRESSIPFGKVNLTQEDKEEIIEYCKHDVLATNQLCTARWGYITAKANCHKISHLSEAECIKNTSAKVCAKMLRAKQMENPNPAFYTIPDNLDKLFRETIHPVILSKFEFAELSNDFEYQVRYLKNEITFGAGGIHSTIGSEVFAINNDKWIIMNADFENLYPSLLVEYNYYATGVPEEGKRQFKYILDTCRRLKKELKEWRASGRPLDEEYQELFNERDSTKLILNAATGAMRQVYSPFYDPQNIIALCFTGQLITVCLAKILFSLGAKILQMNTDGITFAIPRNMAEIAKTKLYDVSKITRVPIEIDEEYAIFQKNVNNYILLSSPNAKPKLKGRWAKLSGSDVPLSPLNAPIITEALIAYYVNGTEPEDIISKCNEPLKFMFTTMKGPTYDGVLYESEKGFVNAYNVNRVYATTDTSKGTLFKIKTEDGHIVKQDKIASIPLHCGLWNDEVPKYADCKALGFDYSFYIKEARRQIVDMKQIVFD